MPILKRLIPKLTLLSAICILSSCASLNNVFSDRPANSVLITDYSKQMNAVKTYFPEIYELYINGKAAIDSVYEYEKDGQPKVGIQWHHIR
mgnify:CR=1 FL=1|jgi:type III secretory pathway lipoprotein EscJ